MGRQVGMKITYVVHQFFPRYFSGTEQYVLGLAREFRRRGQDVEVVTLEPDFGHTLPPLEVWRENFEEVPVVRLRVWPELDPNPLRVEYHRPLVGHVFGRYLDERRPELLHVFHLRYLGGNLLDEARVRGLATVVHLMDFWFVCPVFTLLRADETLCSGPPDRGLGCLECVNADLARGLESLGIRDEIRRLFDTAGELRRAGHGLYALYSALMERAPHLRRCLLGAERIVAPSRFLADMMSRNGIPRERMEVVPYGLDEGRMRKLAGRSGPGGGTGARVVFGYVGTLAHHKGVHVLVKAFRAVRGEARLRIHGRASDFPEYAGHLRELAGEDGRIEFAGPFQVAELGEVLGGIDVLVVPSIWYENTPFVVLEAFAAGVPVIATNLGGLSELVRDGVDGELFPRGDHGELARRMQALLDDPERIAGYRKAVMPVKSLSRNASELQAIYDAAMSVARERRPRPTTTCDA